MAFAQIGYLSCPVVHLYIDVAGVFGVPCRVLAGVGVPNALKVGGLGARLRGADEKVAAELEVVGDKSWVVALFVVFLDADFGVFNFLCRILPEVEAYATKLFLVFVSVGGKAALIVLVLGKIVGDIGQGLCFSIGTDVIVFHKVGGR